MIAPHLVEKILLAALSKGGDFSEIYFEEAINSGISLINGKVEKVSSGLDYGIGIRVLDQTKSVYVYSNNLTPENLIRLAQEASAALQSLPQNHSLTLTPCMDLITSKLTTSFQDIGKTDKIDLLKRASHEAKAYHSLITQTSASYADIEKKVLVANSTGLFKTDFRARTRLTIEAIASSTEEKQSGYFGPGSALGFDYWDTFPVEEKAREAARIAITMLEAKPAPSGKMPVVIENGFGGVIFHEACGHSLEATSVGVKASVFSDKQHQMIASPLVTAIDDGTMPGEWGSLAMDDEGHPTTKNILIKDGVLQNYMIDILGSRRMKMPPTGAGRRQNYKYAPTSRMTNTYIATGQHNPEDIIKDTEYGLYAANMGGGSVDPATGEFNFAVTEAYLIEKGKITTPVRGATLIGKGKEVLEKIDRVGTNLELAQGMCGSVSGTIPTNVGQPRIRVSQILVGGR